MTSLLVSGEAGAGTRKYDFTSGFSVLSDRLGVGAGRFDVFASRIGGGARRLGAGRSRIGDWLSRFSVFTGRHDASSSLPGVLPRRRATFTARLGECQGEIAVRSGGFGAGCDRLGAGSAVLGDSRARLVAGSARRGVRLRRIEVLQSRRVVGSAVPSIGSVVLGIGSGRRAGGRSRAPTLPVSRDCPVPVPGRKP